MVETAILAGKDSRVLRALRRDPWSIPGDGLQFAIGISMVLNHFNGNYHHPNSSQQRLLWLCARRIRETMLNLSPERMVPIAIAFWKINSKNTSNVIVSPFTTKKGEIDDAVKIMRLIFDSRCLLPPYVETEKWDKSSQTDAFLGLSLILSLIIKGHLQKNDQTWENFLKAVCAQDLAARNILHLMLEPHGRFFGTFFVPASEMSPDSRPKARGAQDLPLWATYLNGDPLGPVALPIPDDIFDEVLKVVSQAEAVNRQIHQDITELLSWFGGHKEEFEFLEKSMWDDILSRPRYGLRSNGKDKIKLDVLSCDHCFSYRSIQFFPDEFPKTKAKIWTSWKGKPSSVTFEIVPDSAIPNDPFCDRIKLTDKFLRFVSLQCYWEIVMGRMAAKEKEAVGRVSPEEREKVMRKLSHVRPFFRKLPEGQKASDSAFEFAQKVFLISSLPEGKTFVREHERGWQEMEAIQPLFTYSIQDVKSWI